MAAAEAERRPLSVTHSATTAAAGVWFVYKCLYLKYADTQNYYTVLKCN